MAKFILHVSTNIASSECTAEFEVHDDDLEGLEGEKREEFIRSQAEDYLPNVMEWWVEEVVDAKQAVEK